MSVDDGKLKSFQVAKGYQNSKQTSTSIFFYKIQEMYGWLTGEKSMGTRVGMEHVQERPYVQLSTSHTHINIPTCGVLR